MRVVLYTNSISAHQLPFARGVVARIGADNFRYVYTGETQGGGQEIESNEPWITKDRACLETCDVLLSGIRDVALFSRRQRAGKKTYYMSERWFKPIRIPYTSYCVTGRFRLLTPAYRRMAKAFVCWLNEDVSARYFAIGPWARKDMLRLGVPAEKIVDWGYFVAPSDKKDNSTLGLGFPTSTIPPTTTKSLRVLWVGRMLWWKRVDTIIRAVAQVNKGVGHRCRSKKEDNSTLGLGLPAQTATPNYNSITLTLVGSGPEKNRLIRMAQGMPNVYFQDSVPIEKVRELMRAHDVYVLSSNAVEGWGAALNEAMSEGMSVVGTFEAGASATLLPDSNNYHAGDVDGLLKLLNGSTLQVVRLPETYTPSGAAERFMKIAD